MDEKLVGFRADAKLRKELKALCATLDVSVKDFLVQLVRETIEKYKKK